MKVKKIAIIDLGSQYTYLIASTVRHLGYSAEIVSLNDWQILISESSKKNQKQYSEHYNAIILSGGPNSIYLDETDFKKIFKNETLPILGICYGMQILGLLDGCKIKESIVGEYGPVSISFENNHFASKLENKIKKVDNKKTNSFLTWMSHRDYVDFKYDKSNYQLIAKSCNNLPAIIIHNKMPRMGVQFHPEVKDTYAGAVYLKYFLNDVAKLKKNWNSNDIYELITSNMKNLPLDLGGPNNAIICAFSGGVDSLVATLLLKNHLNKLFPHRNDNQSDNKNKIHHTINLYPIFINTGLMRPQDMRQIELINEQFNLNIKIVNSENIFLKALRKVSDPEKKRKIIGKKFIEVFDNAAKKLAIEKKIKFKYLLQGTLYPDVIESGGDHISHSSHSSHGPNCHKASIIKSHHNVGGLPARMKLKLIEPLRYFFKDEVRLIAKQLGIDEIFSNRHPFPGPGLAIRILGSIEKDKVKILQNADQILFEELCEQKLYNQTWQAGVILLPVKSVGVKGDSRVHEYVLAIRMVNSLDGMTAKWSKFPYEFLDKVSSRMCSEVKGVSRVVYDITNKPPATIEWE